MLFRFADSCQVATACLLASLYACMSFSSLSFAQESTSSIVIQQEGAVPMTVPAGAVVVDGSQPTPQPTDGQPPTPPPGAPTPDGAKPPMPGAPATGEAANKPVTRGAEPPAPPNKEELEAKPDADGMVEFQFRNQPWPELLKWLAEVSAMSLDWQELPGDYLNIRTRRKYSLEETRDLFNRHLLMRGYTMLEQEGVITVVKTATINPAMVPKVEPSELSELQPHRFVRTSFPLKWLIAEQLGEEFKPLLSANGKLTVLKNTNRLEAMDAAINLVELNKLLEQEQSASALDNLAREFPLEHARAVDAKDQLESFLGVKKNGPSMAGSPDQMAMQMQMQMQMMQQQQQMQGQPGAAPGRSKDVFIVANQRQNSLIVHAEPDKMAIVEAFIKRIDVPSNSTDLSILQTRMRVYRLSAIDPEQFVTALVQMDALEPTTRLQVDKDNNAIIAYASIADHFVIQQVIERLDGSGREFEVLQLRRLKADEVAGSIQFLMGVDEKEQDENDRYGGYFMFGYGGGQEKKKGKDKFRVSANVRDNQVLLWANELEMEEVRKLLVKLGEIPPAEGNLSQIRVIEAARTPETLEYLKRLQETWQKVSPNPLILPDASTFEQAPEQIDPRGKELDAEKPDEAQPDAPQPDEAQPKSESTEQPSKPESSPKNGDASKSEDIDVAQQQPRNSGIAGASVMFAVATQEPAAQEPVFRRNTNEAQEQRSAGQAGEQADEKTSVEPTQAPSGEVPPIQISVDERGNLVISSSDTAALDRLEALMSRNTPPKRPYDVFQVQYARASWIQLSLEEYFDEETKENESEEDLFRFFIFDERPKKDDKEKQLGKRKPVRFISDNDTNTIIAIGADEMERKTILDLIRLWDIPEPSNTKNVRFTKMVKVKYSRAESIVEAIKDAYRDLLSANDKAFQQQNNGSGGAGGKESKRGSSGGGDTVSSGGGLNFAFSGKLSLGADKITNTILVSAEGEPLLKLICEMIDELDQAARPQGEMKVLTLDSRINNKSLETALKAMLGPRVNQQVPGQPGQPGQVDAAAAMQQAQQAQQIQGNATAVEGGDQ